MGGLLFYLIGFPIVFIALSLITYAILRRQIPKIIGSIDETKAETQTFLIKSQVSIWVILEFFSLFIIVLMTPGSPALPVLYELFDPLVKAVVKLWPNNLPLFFELMAPQTNELGFHMYIFFLTFLFISAFEATRLTYFYKLKESYSVWRTSGVLLGVISFICSAISSCGRMGH